MSATALEIRKQVFKDAKYNKRTELKLLTIAY